MCISPGRVDQLFCKLIYQWHLERILTLILTWMVTLYLERGFPARSVNSPTLSMPETRAPVPIRMMGNDLKKILSKLNISMHYLKCRRSRLLNSIAA